MALLGAVLCWSADDPKPYVEGDALPNALKFYPPPPDTNSAAFAYDMAQYKWGKSVRVTDTVRTLRAIPFVAGAWRSCLPKSIRRPKTHC